MSIGPVPRIFGWYDSPGQERPTYEPPLDAPCPHCGEPVRAEDVGTHSMMMVCGASRSYFYRTHSTCHHLATPARRQAVDELVWAAIAAEHGRPGSDEEPRP